MSRTQRNLRLLLGTLLIGLGLAISVPVVLDLASKRIAAELEERLSVVMGGRCRIGSAQFGPEVVGHRKRKCRAPRKPILGWNPHEQSTLGTTDEIAHDFAL